MGPGRWEPDREVGDRLRRVGRSSSRACDCLRAEVDTIGSMVGAKNRGCSGCSFFFVKVIAMEGWNCQEGFMVKSSWDLKKMSRQDKGARSAGPYDELYDCNESHQQHHDVLSEVDAMEADLDETLKSFLKCSCQSCQAFGRHGHEEDVLSTNTSCTMHSLHGGSNHHRNDHLFHGVLEDDLTEEEKARFFKASSGQSLSVVGHAGEDEGSVVLSNVGLSSPGLSVGFGEELRDEETCSVVERSNVTFKAQAEDFEMEMDVHQEMGSVMTEEQDEPFEIQSDVTNENDREMEDVNSGQTEISFVKVEVNGTPAEEAEVEQCETIENDVEMELNPKHIEVDKVDLNSFHVEETASEVEQLKTIVQMDDHGRLTEDIEVECKLPQELESYSVESQRQDVSMKQSEHIDDNHNESSPVEMYATDPVPMEAFPPTTSSIEASSTCQVSFSYEPPVYCQEEITSNTDMIQHLIIGHHERKTMKNDLNSLCTIQAMTRGAIERTSTTMECAHVRVLQALIRQRSIKQMVQMIQVIQIASRQYLKRNKQMMGQSFDMELGGMDITIDDNPSSTVHIVPSLEISPKSGYLDIEFLSKEVVVEPIVFEPIVEQPCVTMSDMSPSVGQTLSHSQLSEDYKSKAKPQKDLIGLKLFPKPFRPKKEKTKKKPKPLPSDEDESPQPLISPPFTDIIEEKIHTTGSLSKIVLIRKEIEKRNAEFYAEEEPPAKTTGRMATRHDLGDDSNEQEEEEHSSKKSFVRDLTEEEFIEKEEIKLIIQQRQNEIDTLKTTIA